MPKLITIKPESQGLRLDKFLNEKIKKLSRSQIKKLILSGQVLINDKIVSPHYFLKAGEVVSVETRDKKQKISTKNSDLQPTPYSLLPNILFEDKDFLVLEKPAGLLVHPTEKGETETLVSWLLKKYPAIKTVGENQYRAGIIHRLDRDVSGVMVIAKTPAAFDHLKNQFKKRVVKKEYLAIVYGQMTELKGEIDLPIGRNKDGQFVAHPRLGEEKFQASDKIARTKYEVIEYLKDYSLLRVNILTGRTHQIRVHLSAIGHPIIGDQTYKPKRKFLNFLRRRIKVVSPGRIMLHSVKIGFYDLENQWREFSSPLPDLITNFINENKK